MLSLKQLNIKVFQEKKSYLEKSLSTSYSYFIHVSWYTENSIMVNKAIVVNAIRETEKSNKKNNKRIKTIL